MTGALLPAGPPTGFTALVVMQLLSEGRSLPTEWLPHIKRLIFEANSIEDISALNACFAIEDLNLSFNDIDDVSPLRNLTNLQKLALQRTWVADVSPLASLASLRVLDLTATYVTDISPLRGLKMLQELRLAFAHVEDFSPLQDLDDLRYLDVRGYDPTAFAALAKSGTSRQLMIRHERPEEMETDVFTSRNYRRF